MCKTFDEREDISNFQVLPGAGHGPHKLLHANTHKRNSGVTLTQRGRQTELKHAKNPVWSGKIKQSRLLARKTDLAKNTWVFLSAFPKQILNTNWERANISLKCIVALANIILRFKDIFILTIKSPGTKCNLNDVILSEFPLTPPVFAPLPHLPTSSLRSSLFVVSLLFNPCENDSTESAREN